MRNTRARLIGIMLALDLCGVLLLSPPSAAGGPGPGGGCGVFLVCEGLSCREPGELGIHPGPCRDPAGTQQTHNGTCGNDGAGGCKCFLPTHLIQITRDCHLP